MIVINHKSKKRKLEAEAIGLRREIESTRDIAGLKSPHKCPKVQNHTAYDIFRKAIKRANNFIKIHKKDVRLKEYQNDSFRAAIVLSISAVDTYMRAYVIDNILYCLTDKKKPLDEELKKIRLRTLQYE